MILTLKNFKCFQDAKFVLPDAGNVLINAPSGFGKSTIFDAIKFVLWGNKDTDTITFGKKKSEVTLEYNDLIFKRSKNPNTFVVSSKKMGIINDEVKFMKTNFPFYPSKFLSLNSVKQTNIIEAICSDNIQELKQKIKILISEARDDVKSKTYNNLLKFKKLVDDSHNNAISSLIECVNNELKYYASEFFEDGIVVKLERFTEVQSTKALKPQISVSLFYKGHFMKPANLSMGEYSRLELAVDLAIYKIANTKCPLLLDEVVAYLDSDLAKKILTFILNDSKMPVFVICHQTTEGIFKNVLKEDSLFGCIN